MDTPAAVVARAAGHSRVRASAFWSFGFLGFWVFGCWGICCFGFLLFWVLGFWIFEVFWVLGFWVVRFLRCWVFLGSWVLGFWILGFGVLAELGHEGLNNGLPDPLQCKKHLLFNGGQCFRCCRRQGLEESRQEDRQYKGPFHRYSYILIKNHIFVGRTEARQGRLSPRRSRSKTHCSRKTGGTGPSCC